MFTFIALQLSCKKEPVTPTPDPPNTTVPGCATLTAPANKASVTANTVTLTWSSVKEASSYDLYLGTTPTLSTIVASNITTTSYTYNILANFSTTYYWYVVPKNSKGSATGCNTAPFSFAYVVIKSPEAINMPLITYFPSYRNPAEYPDQMYKMCHIVNYAFGSVNAGGTVDILNAPTTFSALYTKAKANGCKVFLSINNAANFVTMAATETGRLNFIKDVMAKVRQYNLDGIDIDWEYPKTSDGTDATFAALMKQLSDSLHVDAKYYLSAAITPGIYSGSIRDGIRTEVFSYIDFFNIMAYDDFSTTVPYKQHSSMNTANVSLNYWLTTRGMPREKCILGIPGYGRNSGAAQVATSYRTILTSGAQLGPAPIHQSDSATITKSDGSTFTTYYNGVLTVAAKTKLAKDRANGVFFWEIGHDATDINLSLHKVAADALGKSY